MFTNNYKYCVEGNWNCGASSLSVYPSQAIIDTNGTSHSSSGSLYHSTSSQATYKQLANFAQSFFFKWSQSSNLTSTTSGNPSVNFCNKESLADTDYAVETAVGSSGISFVDGYLYATIANNTSANITVNTLQLIITYTYSGNDYNFLMAEWDLGETTITPGNSKTYVIRQEFDSAESV